jgi:hypothetical protein
MLNFAASQIRYDPYPLVVLRPALEPGLYDQLSASFPEPGLFAPVPKYEYKLSMSERTATDNYHRFIATHSAWKAFHGWVKSEAFIRQTVDFLAAQNIDLDLKECFQSPAAHMIKTLRKGRFPAPGPRLRSRFEFSVLKADGGEVAPHTDTPRKIITLVLAMIRDGEWEPHYGGNLDINRPTDPAYAFNWKNRVVPWDKIELVESIPFVPNQCMVFVKTFNSLHSVRRMTQAGSKALRKTVTIVIEKDD